MAERFRNGRCEHFADVTFDAEGDVGEMIMVRAPLVYDHIRDPSACRMEGYVGGWVHRERRSKGHDEITLVGRLPCLVHGQRVELLAETDRRWFE